MQSAVHEEEGKPIPKKDEKHGFRLSRTKDFLYMFVVDVQQSTESR
jgi:hypothetical protein